MTRYLAKQDALLGKPEGGELPDVHWEVAKWVPYGGDGRHCPLCSRMLQPAVTMAHTTFGDARVVGAEYWWITLACRGCKAHFGGYSNSFLRKSDAERVLPVYLEAWKMAKKHKTITE
jgi:hypothetical protein